VKLDDKSVPIKVANEKNVEVIMRYAMMPLTRTIEVLGTVICCSKSIINYSGKWIKPGDVLEEEGARFECFGMRSDGSCVFVDAETRWVTIRDLETINLECVCPDGF